MVTLVCTVLHMYGSTFMRNDVMMLLTFGANTNWKQNGTNVCVRECVWRARERDTRRRLASERARAQQTVIRHNCSAVVRTGAKRWHRFGRIHNRSSSFRSFPTVRTMQLASEETDGEIYPSKMLCAQNGSQTDVHISK